MSTPPTLSAAPPEHPALDYAYLREEGIRHIERLAGHVWTDYNVHDPGITILEQLCYAITDLAYRASYDVPDLLAGSGDPYGSLYSAATILTSHPVTLLDLRKVILDVEGVKNAWIEPAGEASPPLYHHDGEKEIRFQPEPPYTAEVAPRGRHKVLIEKSDLLDLTDEKVKHEVARRLHAGRPLCTDLVDIRVLGAQPIQVRAEVEIGPVDDAEQVLLGIYEVLAEHISPSARFSTLGEMLAAGKRSDEIFDGPPLDHGFLGAGALDRLARKEAVYTSDLLREIMSVPGVRTVRDIAVSAGDTSDPWRLPLDPDLAPRLDLEGSAITLTRGRLTARLDTERLLAALVERRRQAASARKLAPADRDFPPPAGRDRNVGRYTSIQHHFPAIYGVGAGGLPASATDARRAQAKQLKAYLLFFDQILANSFAQLAGAPSLLSFHEEETRSYFAEMVDDPDLGLDEVRVRGPAEHRQRLRQLVEGEADGSSLSSRKNRFLNHLLARFAEQFADYSLVLLGAERRAKSGDRRRPTLDDRPGRPRLREAGGVEDRLAPDKRAFLQRYPRISSARGTGMNALSPPGADNTSGLEERVERKLGLVAEDGERLAVVERALLLPIEEDNLPPGDLEYGQIPILAAAASADPWSLQLSVVIQKGGRLREAGELPPLVEQTIVEETPAHLTPHLLWLGPVEWASFEAAHRDWQEAFRAYRAAKLGLEAGSGDRARSAGGAPALPEPRHYRVRDARDRLIDLLRFGETYPLRDLPVRDERLTVPFNQPARIPIDHSQRGVIYELRSARDDTPIEREEDGRRVRVQEEGNGGTIFLVTPPIQDNVTYNILARKVKTGRQVYLRQQASVKVGLDVTLRARILDAPPLDPNNDPPDDDDARIVAHGAVARVQIDQPQEGVDYHALRVAAGQEHRLSPDVRGIQGAIVLTLAPADEDADIRIRATKLLDGGEADTALLDIVLPLKVRARRDLSVSMAAPIVDFGGGASVRVDGTQTSARYSLYLGPVLDRDFVFDAAAPGLLGADVPGEPRVHVARPPDHPIWRDVPRFTQVGAPVQGNGGALTLPLGALTRDSVVLVRADKDHQDGATISSSVQLRQAALLLVRPDPAPALRIGVILDGQKTTGTLEVAGGQPGVFYQARTAPAGPDAGEAAYFHKTDDLDPAVNKGLGQLRIGVDVVVTRGTARPATTPAELSATPPLTPIVETGPLGAGTTLSFRAMKAQTRVAAPLRDTAEIAALPEIVAQPAAVAAGGSADIVVRQSRAGDRYELWKGGQPIGQAQGGNGADLAFSTGPVAATTNFEVRVTRPAQPGIPVERRARITVTVTS